MADLAAHLVDAVVPDVPYRQWVLSLPFLVRRLCAYDAAVCRAVRRVLVRAVNGFYLRRRAGLSRPRCGAVVFVQRFDSALKLNVHFHGLWADGLFDCLIGGSVDFHAQDEVTDATLRARGVEIVKVMPPEVNGKFAHIVGPDGIKIELWEPVADDPYDP